MAAVELSYDRDWVRFRTSYFCGVGRRRRQRRPRPTGFDTIFDNPNFAGGEFSYWQRQQIELFGVNLVQPHQPRARPALEQDPGADELREPGPATWSTSASTSTSRRSCELISNVNFLWFDQTEVLEQFVFQADIDQLHRHRPEHRRRVPAAAEQQRHLRRRRSRRCFPATASGTCTTRSWASVDTLVAGVRGTVADVLTATRTRMREP